MSDLKKTTNDELLEKYIKQIESAEKFYGNNGKLSTVIHEKIKSIEKKITDTNGCINKLSNELKVIKNDINVKAIKGSLTDKKEINLYESMKEKLENLNKDYDNFKQSISILYSKRNLWVEQTQKMKEAISKIPSLVNKIKETEIEINKLTKNLKENDETDLAKSKSLEVLKEIPGVNSDEEFSKTIEILEKELADITKSNKKISDSIFEKANSLANLKSTLEKESNTLDDLIKEITNFEKHLINESSNSDKLLFSNKNSDDKNFEKLYSEEKTPYENLNTFNIEAEASATAIF